jgi:hypothetical protein
MWQHTGLAGSGSGGLAIKFSDSPSLDAFARQRISEPFTLFDSKQIWDDSDIANDVENYPLFYDNQETSGAGTSTVFNVNRASTTLGVSATTAGTRTRQTKQRFNYQPGKSQLVIITGILGGATAGITKRFGYFDANDGLFFEQSGSGMAVVARSNVSGSPIDTAVAQADWNIDKMNGAGASGINLDFSKVQIFFFDFEWLGVGRVRFGFYVDGLPFYCHEVLNANNLTSVYMSNPNLPVRTEIINDGSGAADNIEHICTTVVSEGGIQPNGVLRFGDIGDTTAEDISTPTAGVTYALCGIRLKSNYLSADIREVFVSVIENSGANNAFVWRLHLNPTITAALTYSDVANSAIQFGIADTGTPANNVILTANYGTVIAGGYQSRTDANANIPLESASRLGSLIDGTVDQYVLSSAPITANNLFFAGLQWREAW